MKKLISLFGLLLSAYFLYAQKERNTLSFELLRQNDSIHIISKENFYHRMKSIPLGNNTKLSFGGSYRFQSEHFINENFVKDIAPTQSWLLHRGMLHADLKFHSKFQLFAELNSSLTSNKQHISPVDEDELYVNQLFIKYDFNKDWHILLGRQNMRLGSARLVDVREGPNVRLSFDMAEWQYHSENTTVTGFYAIPVQQKQGVFDNDALNTDETLLALYWTQLWNKNNTTDIYILYKNELNKEWDSDTANDKRASFGLRMFGQWHGIDYNNEFIYQTGKFGEATINAFAISLNLEKEFKTLHPFTFGVKADVISGDDRADDNSLNTFDGLYPRGVYFGKVAYFGPSNLIAIHPSISSKIGRVTVNMDYVAFWRYSTKDGVYDPPLILSFPSDNSEKFIANQVGASFSYQFNNYLNMELESNLIFPGSFLKESGHNKTLSHFVFTLGFQF
ncbi:alginate export protein [Balneicella halophila]|uniref:Alginate export protein n=1 Tax=Balneicella halophila TaxID=1537566 RepID=A0A7L4UPT2_BALHA|nr:porin [Balneicella halophila]PVX50816.1 alginate export protein [Balneicella halophila]